MNSHINERIRDLWEPRGERRSLPGHLLPVLAKYSESRPRWTLRYLVVRPKITVLRQEGKKKTVLR